eukprot:gene6349-7076_t
MACASATPFRQICDKACATEIKSMKWSPKNDLIAILTSEGEIRLHRLYWSKVWTLSEKTVKYTALAWNPEGTGSTNQEFLISDLHISSNLELLFSVQHDATRNENPMNSISVHEMKLLSTRVDEIATVAVKFEKINKITNEFESELKKISESWENILQKVSSKLEAFSQVLPTESSVSEEFLLAFACGQLSPELQAFLCNDLTSKGLRKLGNDVNTSYGNIKGSVIDKVQSLCYDFSFELSELLGMARWYEKYGILGLCEVTVQDCLQFLGSFMLKIREIINIIDRDLKSFRAFFKWLSGVMARVSDEPTPNYFKEFNQEDNANILYFLRTQLVEREDKDSFILERVGQYVQKGELSSKQDQSTNPWYKFVNNSSVLRDSPFVVMPDDSASLLDMSSVLQQKAREIFEKATITGSLVMKNKFSLPQSRLPDQSTDSITTTTCFLPCCCQCDTFYIFKLLDSGSPNMESYKYSVDICKIPNQLKSNCKQTVIKDICFYDKETITLLLGDGNDSLNPVQILAQLPIETLSKCQLVTNELASSATIPPYDVSSHVTKWRDLNAFDSSMMTVSGVRRVSCLLSKNKRRVLIFDMDAEAEEEEEEEDEDYEPDMED